MLADRFAAEIGAHLLPVDQWRPYPTATDRDGWLALSTARRAALMATAEPHLGQPWPALPATLFMEYARVGNRRRYEVAHFARRGALIDLILAECATGDGRFLDEIINGVWAICEESFWGIPAHNSHGRRKGHPLPDTSDPVIDLFAAETGALIAWALYLLEPQLDAVHPVIAERLRREVDARIMTPYRDRDDFGWMGLTSPGRVNNWNPWCASNCLTCALLLERDPGRRTAAVTKTLRIVDRFLASYAPDGGCDEGTSYWGRAGASLFDNLDLLESATGGWLNVWDDPLVANIGRYPYRCFIDGDWYVNFADGGARVRAEAPLLCRYGRKIGDDHLIALGRHAHNLDQGASEIRFRVSSLLRLLPELFDCPELDQPAPAAALPSAYGLQFWLENIEVMTAREQAGSPAGLYLAAKGGHNAESHNHNDVGQFIVYLDGQPVVIDLGVETYTAQTFSGRRYEIWTMQSSWHNLPTIGGVQQTAGRQSMAAEVDCDLTDRSARLSLDLAPAYPPEAGIRRWQRSVNLDRDSAAVSVVDTCELAQPQPVTLSLILANEPTLLADGLLSGGAAVAWTPGLLASVDRVDVSDERLRPAWGEAIWRLLLATPEPVSAGRWQLTVKRAPTA